MNSKSVQILVAIIAILVFVAFAATKLQLRSSDSPKIAPAPVVTEGSQADSSERIKRLETELMVANVLYLKAQLVAMQNAATFFDAMAKKVRGDLSESTYGRIRDEAESAKLDSEKASEKARTLYLALKNLDPHNKTLLEIRDAGRVKGGISPYDD